MKCTRHALSGSRKTRPEDGQIAWLTAFAVPLDGDGLVPLLANENGPWRDTAVSYFNNKQLKALDRTIRTRRYRYTERADGEPIELIDYETDSYEWANLVDDPAHAETRAQLKAL